MQLFIIRACSSHPAPDGAQLLQTMATPTCAVGTPQAASRPSPALLLSECSLATKGLNPSVFLQPVHSWKELQAYFIQVGLSSWSICVIAASEQQRQRGDLGLHLLAKRHHELRNVHVHCRVESTLQTRGCHGDFGLLSGRKGKYMSPASFSFFFFSASAPEQQPQPRPYQGVRVKEPVKELLKRKRGNVHNTSTTAATTVGEETNSGGNFFFGS